MDLPEFAIEAEGVVKIYPATKTAPQMHALRGLDGKDALFLDVLGDKGLAASISQGMAKD